MRRLLVPAAVVAAILAALTPVPAHAALAPSNPTTWRCDAQHLGLGTDTVELAPLLTGGGAPGTTEYGPPDARGRWVPIIMVHGWTGQDTHTSVRDGAFSHPVDMTPTAGQHVTTTRSLIDSLQHLAGAAVFTFDYRDYAASWVDDSHLGPALGSVIDCLYRASGERVIIVSHSMGGLIARYAASHPASRASEISRVITFGTPETGSVAAAVINGALIGAALTSDAVALIRLVLAYCGALASTEIRTGTACDALPDRARAFLSTAGRALEYGSPQLAALGGWPKGIVMNALAGNSSFTTAASWFGLGPTTSTIELGDMIVTTGSALDHATTTTTATCRYQLVVGRAVTEHLELWAGLIGPQDVASQPFVAFAGACFHTALMRDIELTNTAIHRVQEDLAARLAATGQQYITTDLPGVCGTISAPGRPMAVVSAPFGETDCTTALAAARQYYQQPAAAYTTAVWSCMPDDNSGGGPDPRIANCFSDRAEVDLDRPIDRTRPTPDCTVTALAAALRSGMKPPNSYVVDHRCAFGYAVVRADNGIDGFAAALVYRDNGWHYVSAGTDESGIALDNSLSRPVINALIVLVDRDTKARERVRI
jgi:pimeloyl-ACP methyl ester carboxylesterase